MRIKSKKGQSTLEYIILVTAIIATLILFLGTGTGPFRQTVNTTYTGVTNGMETMSNRLVESWNNEE